MTTAEVHFSGVVAQRLQELAQATGKTPEDLVNEGLELLAERDRLALRRERIERVAGIWKDRDDLPNFEAMRREFDRRLPDGDRP